ncbi:MAG: penicillin acylase family protein [Nitritalea sp.]
MKKLLWIVPLSLLLVLLIGFFWLRQSHLPAYSGSLRLSSLQAPVAIHYDAYGIPHLYAENLSDAYQAFGWVHAQDRLFQLEMMRRVGTGTLAELLGEDLVEIDRFFHTLGIPAHARESAEAFRKNAPTPVQDAVTAYIEGVNAFIREEKWPLEYRLLGQDPRPYTLEDMHGIIGYMSFTFAMAMKTDPLVTYIAERLGPDYLSALHVHTGPEHSRIPNHYEGRWMQRADPRVPQAALAKLLEKLPVPLLMGSNAWVLSGERSASGQVLFANDTHIGFAQPSVWYEAHLETPELQFYGNHLAGVPFGLVGHSRTHAFGLTMFENDDQDFFVETVNPENELEVRFGEAWEPLKVREVTLAVKDADSVSFQVFESRHGPLMQEVLPELQAVTEQPVSTWWIYTKQETRALEALYRLNHAENPEEVAAAAALIHAPGLNIMYGDAAGNIAWWAAAQLYERPEGVDAKIFRDGSKPEQAEQRMLPFSQNPQSINPPSGYVISANNQPDTLANGLLYPGYYYPGDRWARIAELLETQEKWTLSGMQAIHLDVKNKQFPSYAAALLEAISSEDFKDIAPALTDLAAWDGDHDLGSSAPLLYYTWLYYTLQEMMEDELGADFFEGYLKTFLHIRSVGKLLLDPSHAWWNRVDETGTQTSEQIIRRGLEKAQEVLLARYGKVETWTWSRAVTLEHPHPLGAVAPLDKLFNVPAPVVPANEETVNKLAFDLNGTGAFSVRSGPAMRILLDFGDVDAALSVLPTGQSGNRFSPHYADQVKLFTEGKYRPMDMNRERIQNQSRSKLVLQP